MLSKLFQTKFVDITYIGSVIRTEITQLKILFLNENTNLNVVTFNEDTNFHVLPDFGPFVGYMSRFPTQIMKSKFLVWIWVETSKVRIRGFAFPKAI